jgi:hypothetical protein
MSTTATWVIAAVCYSVLASLLPTPSAVALSVLLLLAALIINNKAGHDVFVTLGLPGAFSGSIAVGQTGAYTTPLGAS